MRWLTAGLFCVTLATLMLEVLDSRLLSVLAWYHLSFLAVSVAMLGMAAGAVLVFVGGSRLDQRLLPEATGAFALILVLSHLANLAIPFPPVRAVLLPDMVALGVATAMLTVPFVLSGIVVTLALTRTSAPIGLMYGADLIGAAAGCLGIIGLLNVMDITSTALITAAVALLGGWCFARAARRRMTALVVLGVLCLDGAWLNSHAVHPIGVLYPKNRSVWPLLDTVQYAIWNSHSYVIVRRPESSTAWMWGPGTHAVDTPAVVAWSMIDGEAGTPITKWDGNRASLGWVESDVTALPYRLRHGRVGIIGVGGGRDVLTAIEAGNSAITGIEINRTFVDLLTGPYRTFAGIADRPGVRLVHDEARAYLTRTRERFDVLQMSLIDTWAATGAGAFTLTENGLYTREGWRVFLRTLAPGGVFSVSRWYAPGAVSETTRLLSLGVASLLDSSVDDPSAHIVLASAGNVATLLLSPAPFSSADRAAVEDAAGRYGFEILVSPWTRAADARLGLVVRATTIQEVNRAVQDSNFDFSPPTDARPFFFNMLKLGAALRQVTVPAAGIIAGNLAATSTLQALLGIATLLVLAIIVCPLALVGWPDIPAAVFGWSLAYFAAIGGGFMLIQIAFLQRFSVYLGHPTYTFSVILFLMILSAGAGSLLSERVVLARLRLQVLVLGIAAIVLAEARLLQPAMDGTIDWNLFGRTTIVAVFVVPLACGLGLCFPIGIRLIGRHSQGVTAWMWGVNGAFGVLASIVAVMVSLWWGIGANMLLAAVLYGLLVVPIGRLAITR